MMGIRMVCYAPILAIGGIIMAVGKSASMSWIIAVACITLVGLIAVLMSIAMPKFKAIQKLVDRLNLVSRESLSGMMVIRAFGTQNHEEQRFEAANEDLPGTTLFVQRVMVFMMPAMMLIMNGVTVLIIWVGAHQISASSMQVGDMMAFMQYAMQIIMAFLMISMMFIFMPRAAVAGARIAEVLGTKNSIVDPGNPRNFDEAQKGKVEFKQVSFRYPGAEKDTLEDITFTALPGQTTAIIGPTGSGKSTVANLVLRFYDASGGQVMVDGADVREVRQKDLRGRIGYVPQKGMLLSGSIASNLRYGRQDATDEEIEHAALVAQATEFISEKPDGFESEIAQGGANVSGGQKQRLSIARALAKNPEILVFDDSFSALDFRTDAALRKALKDRLKDCTVIIVAQRVSTIMSAEQIIVLDEGKIVGIGTHAQLLKQCPEYYEIASSQLSQEELA
jgi:ATP-binding cassette subfamily B protein